MCLPCAVAARFAGAVRPVTVTDALPETVPTAAVTEPLPVLVELAVNVVELPLVGDTLPGAVVDQVAPATLTGLPYRSAPEALNGCVPPCVTVAEAGETAIEASAVAFTVSRSEEHTSE